MPFVKLDCGILDSTIWWDREAREIFITALLMAEPKELVEPEPQYEVDALNKTGWEVPPGWYGFVRAAGSGIVRRAGVEEQTGIEALKRLGSPEEASRTPDFDGRRLVRVNGGYIVLNFQKYRDKDHTAAERAARYRERKRQNVTTERDGHAVTPSRHTVTTRSVTQAEAEAEAEKKRERGAARPRSLSEVKGYWEERNLQGDSEEFWDHFEANGWRQGGKSPLRDWKAAARGWSRREPEFNHGHGKPSSGGFVANNPEIEERRIADIVYGKEKK